MIRDVTYTIVLMCIACVLLGVIIGVVIQSNIYYYKNNVDITPNEQSLNQYATFESTCSYRGYDRDECLLIWSGR